MIFFKNQHHACNEFNKKLHSTMNIQIITAYHSRIAFICKSQENDVVTNYKVSLTETFNNKENVLMCQDELLINKKFEHVFKEPIKSGAYTLSITDNETLIYSSVVIIAPVGKLSNGPTCFVFDGKCFDYQGWCVLTNNHALNTCDNVTICINNIKIKLRPDLLWITSSNDKLDYSCVGISDHDKTFLENNNIMPLNIKTTEEKDFVNDNGILIHHPYYSPHLLQTPCRITSRLENKIKYEYLNCYPSSGGSSGSPVFGYNSNKELEIHGLHKAKNTCVKISKIIEDLNIKNMVNTMITL